MEGFYDQKAKAGGTVETRRTSPIFALRQLNNWVKARLISEYTPPGAVALDLCCGRGGDLAKWRAAGVQRLVGVDLSEASVQEAAARYGQGDYPFAAGFIVDDASTLAKVPVKEPFADVVSCQFALHYFFDTYERAARTLQNAAARLKQGGYFIGTVPSAARILRRLRHTPTTEGAPQKRAFGNAFYQICMEDDHAKPDAYTFTLADAIDAVPEYLVRLHTLLAAASAAGLAPVRAGVSFPDYLAEHKGGFASVQQRLPGEYPLEPALQEVFALYDVFVFRKV